MIVSVRKASIDLKEELDIPFDLNGQQVEALNHLARFLESDSTSTVLSGSAGTGKSTLTKILLHYIYKVYDYGAVVTLAAPTHKAKGVLKNLSGSDKVPTTLHKMLGLSPDVSIEAYDARDLKFSNINFDPSFFFSEKEIVIIDECSMINNDLFDLIIEKIGEYAQIIFIGDIAQLPPVKQEDISKVFSCTDFKGYELTEVMRQASRNPLLKVLTRLRSDIVSDFTTEVDEDSGIYTYSDGKQFVKSLYESIESIDDITENPFKIKTLGFTNDRVSQLNGVIRKLLKRKEVIEDFDLLIARDNYYAEEVVKGGKWIEHRETVAELYNCSEYIVTKITEKEKDLPYYKTMRGFELKLFDVVDAKYHKVWLLSPYLNEVEYTRLAHALESIRKQASNKRTPGYLRKLLWTKWYKLKDSFVCMRDLMYDNRAIKKKTLDYGYAITTHLSQGSTYDSVFIDMNNILRYNLPITRALQYVSMSRARFNAHLLI